MTTTRSRAAVLALAGCTVAALLVTASLGLGPSGALGATVLGETPDSAALTSTSTTLPDAESALEQLQGIADDPKGSITAILEDATGEGDDGDPEPPDDPGEEEEEETSSTSTTMPPPPAEQNQTEPPPATSETGEEESGMGEEAPTRLYAELDQVRELSWGAAPPVIVDFSDLLPRPLIDFVDVPAGPRSTREIVDLLEQAGATQEDVARILTPFPVAGQARFSNDWGALRHSPYPHAHEGTDIFASRGTPVIASFGGVVTGIGRDTAVGGNSVRVSQPDGTYVYYAHLDGFGPAAVEGSLVVPGAVLGFVGTTGNAVGTPPHLHYEIHPGGGEAVPPLPYLDSWIAAATVRARAFAQAGGLSVGAELQAPPVPQPGLLPLVPFQPAAATEESIVPGLLMIFLMAAGALLIRRRRRYLVPLRLVLGRLKARFPHLSSLPSLSSRRPPVLRRIVALPFEPGKGTDGSAEDRVVDVLEPFLRRERVGARH